jgi:hypothetical protein
MGSTAAVQQHTQRDVMTWWLLTVCLCWWLVGLAFGWWFMIHDHNWPWPLSSACFPLCYLPLCKEICYQQIPPFLRPAFVILAILLLLLASLKPALVIPFVLCYFSAPFLWVAGDLMSGAHLSEVSFTSPNGWLDVWRESCARWVFSPCKNVVEIQGHIFLDSWFESIIWKS